MGMFDQAGSGGMFGGASALQSPPGMLTPEQQQALALLQSAGMQQPQQPQGVPGMPPAPPQGMPPQGMPPRPMGMGGGMGMPPGAIPGMAQGMGQGQPGGMNPAILQQLLSNPALLAHIAQMMGGASGGGMQAPQQQPGMGAQGGAPPASMFGQRPY